MDPMGIDGRKEGQYDGYPFVPQNAERPQFARCVRNAIVEHVLDGAQAVYRFGDGQRFKFPVPEGDKLLSHVVRADVIAVQGNRKSIQVTVHFPCVAPHAMWASDPFEATIRVEYVARDWDLPKPHDADRRPRPRDAGIDLERIRDEEVPVRPARRAADDEDRWHGFHEDILEQETTTAPKTPPRQRTITAIAAIIAFGVGMTIAEQEWGTVAWAKQKASAVVRDVRQQLQKIYDWIDGPR